MPPATTLLPLGLSVLTVVIAIPLAWRRIPPNRWYGLRVPATFADREVWYAANARTGRDLLWLGVVLLFVALVLPSLPPAIPFPLRPLVFVPVAAVGGLVIAVRGVRHASRLLAERRGGGPGGPSEKRGQR